MPPLLGAFRARYPGIVISLEVANRATVLERLAQNELDLTIMGRPPQGIAHVAQPFLADALVVIAATGSPLARLRRIPVARLVREPFVMREPGSGPGSRSRSSSRPGACPSRSPSSSATRARSRRRWRRGSG